MSIDEKLYNHALFNLLVYANDCESKFIPMQIKLEEKLKAKKRMTNDELLLQLKKIHEGKQDISDEGWLSRLYSIITPLKQAGLIKSVREKRKAVYLLSDGWSALVKKDLLTTPQKWFKGAGEVVESS